MLKKIKNNKKKDNKVFARYKYVKDKADWLYENTLERFDFAVKRRFRDKQDTTHFVFSFSRVLTKEEKEKARQLISDFLFVKFGTEYFLSIAEHNDNNKTHYHILLSRNIETSKMLHLSNKEYMQLVKELNNVMSELMNEHELDVKERYGTSQEMQTQLDAWQYKDYQKALKKFLNKDFNLYDTKSFKAAAKAAAEFAARLLAEKDLNTLREFEQHANISFFVEKAKKRERLYVKIADKKIRVDKLSKAAKDRLINYVKAMSVITQTQQQQEQKEEKEAVNIYDVIRESVEEYKKKQQLKEEKQKEKLKEALEKILEKQKQEKQQQEFENRKRFRGPRM